MVEVMASMTIFVVVAGALGMALLSSNNLSEQSNETRIASNSLLDVLEEIKGTPTGSIPDDFAPGVAIPRASVLQLSLIHI